ncbi:LysR family transcriptional regulator, partial [Bacillus megaterium]|nr:LysR family transcriptional regulator [Priestia megaterium]
KKYRNLVFKKLLDGHMVAAVNKKPLAKQTLITEEMLINQPIVLYNDKYIQNL